MIKVLATALSLASFLNMLDAQGLAMEDVFYEGAELNRIQKRSTFDPKKVLIWLESAKNNTKEAIKALDKFQPQAKFRTELRLAKEALEDVDTESSESQLIDLRNALWYAVNALKDMLSVYETTTERVNKNRLLNAILHVTGACVDLTIALAEAISDPHQKADVSEKADRLQKELLTAAPEDTELPKRVSDLAEKVLKRTEIR